MSIQVTIVTTANRVRRFNQSDETHIQSLLESLRRTAQMFSGHSLIVASANETELFSPKAITRIEIETQRDLNAYLPHHGATRVTALDVTDAPRVPRIEDAYFAGQVDFYFEGGDVLPTWVEGPRPAGPNERLANLTRMFEQPFLLYGLTGGGYGLMNPAVMTRALVHAPADMLPVGAWRLNQA